MSAILELYTLLGRAYAAVAMKQGSVDAVRDDFTLAAEDDPDFTPLARQKLDELIALENRIGVGKLAQRDYCSSISLAFLRERLGA